MGRKEGKEMNEDMAYNHGLDCGKNGADTTNCHFSNFSKPEYTKAWERGKKDADTPHTEAE